MVEHKSPPTPKSPQSKFTAISLRPGGLTPPAFRSTRPTPQKRAASRGPSEALLWTTSLHGSPDHLDPSKVGASLEGVFHLQTSNHLQCRVRSQSGFPAVRLGATGCKEAKGEAQGLQQGVQRTGHSLRNQEDGSISLGASILEIVRQGKLAPNEHGFFLEVRGL